MSNIALHPSPDTGESILVYAKNCTDEDRNRGFICPSCGAGLKLRGGGQISRHFYGRHFPNCNIARFCRTTLIIKNGFCVNLLDICNHRDQPFEEHGAGPSSGPTPGPEPPPRTGPESDPEEEKKEIIYTPKALNTAKALQTCLWHCPLNLSINLDGSVRIGDILIRRDNLLTCRKNGIDREIRLALVRRVNPTTLPDSIRKPGYIVFRDAFSISDEDAIYFLVRLEEVSQHQHFFDLIAGPQGVRDPHRYIALLGKWKRLGNCKYNAYYSEINSRCYYFTNRRD